MGQSLKWFVENKSLSLVIVILVLFSSGCLHREYEYAFFVAGHAYGKPSSDGQNSNYGLYSLFRARFEALNAIPNMELGVLTGDFVWFPDSAHFDSLDRDLKKLNFPVKLCPGNHDASGWDSTRSARYNPRFFSETHHNDLFIFLDPNLKAWNIMGEQLEWLRSVLNQKGPKSRNIFVFMHQVLWWNREGSHSQIAINSPVGRMDTINFESTILPLFRKLEKPVYFFAGDVGAIAGKEALFYFSEQNLHFLASGMGGGERENFLVITSGKKEVPQVRFFNLQTKEFEKIEINP